MGSNTDAKIYVNEENARVGYVVAAQPGYFLLNETNADEPLPILAGRIGRDSECDCVLPVTCLGTHGSQTYVLRPDGKVTWNALSYGGAAPEYESLAEWQVSVTAAAAAVAAGHSRLPWDDDAKIDDSKAEAKAAERAADIPYFGGCPNCGKTDGYINIGRDHWFCCEKHKAKWCIGSNLFSAWRDQTEEEQRKIHDDLGFGSFKTVEPIYGAAGESATAPKITDEIHATNIGKIVLEIASYERVAGHVGVRTLINDPIATSVEQGDPAFDAINA